jgi:hypothetical protein
MDHGFELKGERYVDEKLENSPLMIITPTLILLSDIHVKSK